MTVKDSMRTCGIQCSWTWNCVWSPYWIWVASRGAPLSACSDCLRQQGSSSPAREPLRCAPSIPLMTMSPLNKSFSVSLKPTHEGLGHPFAEKIRTHTRFNTSNSVANGGNYRAHESLLNRAKPSTPIKTHKGLVPWANNELFSDSEGLPGDGHTVLYCGRRTEPHAEMCWKGWQIWSSSFSLYGGTSLLRATTPER